MTDAYGDLGVYGDLGTYGELGGGGDPLFATSQVVSWMIGAGFSTYSTEVWVSRDDNWSLLATVAAGVTTYTDDAVNPSERTKYRIRHVTTDGAQGLLYSAWSPETTETPGVTHPPGAPIYLAPDSYTVDPSAPIPLTWVHQSLDGSGQTKYTVWHRAQGDPGWEIVGPITSGASLHSLTEGTYEDGQIVEWQVQTWGADPSPGPRSASATFDTAVAPISDTAIRLPVELNTVTGQMEASSTSNALRTYVMRAQARLKGGGVRSVDSSFGVHWSQRFLTIDLGYHQSLFPSGWHDINFPGEWAVTHKALASNRATLTTTGNAVKVRPGEIVVVSGAGAPFDGKHVVRVTGTNSVQYDCPGPNLATTAVSDGYVRPVVRGHGGRADLAPVGGRIQLPDWTALYYSLPFGWGGGSTPRKNGVVIPVTRSRSAGVATLTVSAPHYIVPGDRITVGTGDESFDGGYKNVTAVTGTSVSYTNPGVDVPISAVTGPGRLVSPSGVDTFQGGFHAVGHQEAFVVPDNWLMIASRNSDTNLIEWGTGDDILPGGDSESPVYTRAILTSTSDVNTDAGNMPPLRIGDVDAFHIRVDGNEIQAMQSDDVAGNILLNAGGGAVTLGSATEWSRVYAPGLLTGSYSANMNWDAAGGQLRVNTSAQRFKRNIQPLPAGVAIPEVLLELEPRMFQRIEDEVDADGLPVAEADRPWYVGFVAEEAAALGLEHWVIRDDSGDPFSFAYDYWVVALQAIARAQAARIDALEGRVAAIEAALL